MANKSTSELQINSSQSADLDFAEHYYSLPIMHRERTILSTVSTPSEVSFRSDFEEETWRTKGGGGRSEIVSMER